jgi:predicted site-specific integrase-resolvase
MRYFTLSSLAESLGISRQTIWRWCRLGKIKVEVHEIHQNGTIVQMPYVTEKEAKRLGVKLPIDRV